MAVSPPNQAATAAAAPEIEMERMERLLQTGDTDVLCATTRALYRPQSEVGTRDELFVKTTGTT